MMRKINFYRRLHRLCQEIVFCAMFLCRFCHIVAILCIARFLLFYSSAIKLVTDHFECYVNS